MTRAALLLAAGLMMAPSGCFHRRPPHHDTGQTPVVAPDLSIFFAADVHGRTELLARRATMVDRARAEGHGVVQLDAGDLFARGDPGLVAKRARVLLAAYRRMGVDAMTVGERELALGPETVKSIASAAGVPVVASNLVDGAGANVFEHDRIVLTDQGAVGVFAVVEPRPDVAAGWSRQWGLVTTDPVTSSRAAATSLRARGARVVVGLFNGAGGVARATQVARMAGGVDVMVVGNAAQGGDPGLGRRPLVVHTTEGGAEIGRIDVRLRSGRPRLSTRMLEMTPEVPEELGVGLVLRMDAGPVSQAPPPKYAERWMYASNEACGFCHKPELTQWQSTEHALAFATLRDSGHGAEPACLGCHMTGFLQPGGTQFVATAVEQMADVGCECCHGPSAPHVASVDKTKGTVLKVDASLCFGCHTPDQSVEPFDVASAMKKILGPGHGEAPKR
jgi:hypothetical protein